MKILFMKMHSDRDNDIECFPTKGGLYLFFGQEIEKTQHIHSQVLHALWISCA